MSTAIAVTREVVAFWNDEHAEYHFRRASAQLEHRNRGIRAVIDNTESLPFTTAETARMAYLSTAPERARLAFARVYDPGSPVNTTDHPLTDAETWGIVQLMRDARDARLEVRRIQTAARVRKHRAAKKAAAKLAAPPEVETIAMREDRERAEARAAASALAKVSFSQRW